MSILSPKIVCNFCFQISDLLYTWCGKSFTLAVEEKPKRGIFYLLAVGGGGGSGSPRENFWKTDANGTFWAHFCWVRVYPPPKKKKKIVCNFCLQSSDLHDAGDFFSFCMGMGVGGGSSRFCFCLFFFFEKRIHEFYVSFSNHYYSKLRYRWHWVIGFHFILIFLIPPYFSPFSPSRPIFSYVHPIASRPLPHPLPFPLSTPHLPVRRLIAVVVIGPWIWRPIR